MRNRLISGLSVGVLIVEAPERSGALITADHALEQGRDVYAIPGNLGVKQCEGSNRLLREGAVMVEDGWELLREYVYLFPGKLSDGRKKEALEERYQRKLWGAATVYSPLPLEEDDKKVIDKPGKPAYSVRKEALPALTRGRGRGFCATDRRAHFGGRSGGAHGAAAQRILAALTMLQIKGLALKEPGNRYRRSGKYS